MLEPLFWATSPRPKMRSVVLVRGILRGMGRESRCEMLAIKDKHPETSECSYSRCSVIEALADLPDGEYTVSFENRTATVVRQGGLWLVGPDPLSSVA
jgi:hypothetical protein